MRLRRKSILWFAVFHMAAAAVVLLFPYYRIGAAVIYAVVPSCILHDWFHVYCPLCGGTRAANELMHFHLLESFRFHPLVPVVAVIALVYYVLAWIRLFRGKPLLSPVPKPLSISLVVAILAFWVLRNLLLIAFGIDPTGDLIAFWN